ncbi:MAG: outer membrane lipoprotein carrier protein LolA [Alphaproteobacteria bacterium]|nr:MAG: outer membrane lipoprotein carrier protein LolA [Alphaproteobacteria bacterium]
MTARTMFGVTLALMLALPANAQDQAGQQTAAQDQEALPPVEEQAVDTSVGDKNLAALRQIQDYMDGVKSLEADFMQRANNGNVARGTLYMERPGRIRFEYADDVPFLVVADGKTLNFVDYEVGQVTKWPVKDTPMLALLGSSFDLASVNAHIEVEPQGIPGLIALSALDPKQPELGSITIYFKQVPTRADGSDASLLLQSWLVTDAKGERTYVEISNSIVNPALKDTLWTFEDPRGLKRRRGVR